MSVKHWWPFSQNSSSSKSNPPPPNILWVWKQNLGLHITPEIVGYGKKIAPLNINKKLLRTNTCTHDKKFLTTFWLYMVAYGCIGYTWEYIGCAYVYIGYAWPQMESTCSTVARSKYFQCKRKCFQSKKFSHLEQGKKQKSETTNPEPQIPKLSELAKVGMNFKKKQIKKKCCGFTFVRAVTLDEIL